MTAAPAQRGLVAFSARLDRVCGHFAMLALAIMLGSILLQVVARYVFDAPPPWTEELGRYAMIWSGMLGATMAYYRRADPVLATSWARGSPGRELAGQVIELVALIAFLAPVFYYAPGFIERHSRRITETLEINSALVVVIVPVSLAVLFVHQLARVSAALQALGRDSRS